MVKICHHDTLVNILYNALCGITLVYLRISMLLMMMVYARVIYINLTFNIVILVSLFAALLSLLTFPPLLPMLG